MGATNSRNAYRFNPDDLDDQSGGGLLGLLQAAMQQRQAQPRTDFGPAANGYDGSRSDWLARLSGSPNDQAPYQSFARGGGQAPTAQADPNFRQLVRVSAPGQFANDPSDRSYGSYGPAQASFDRGSPASDVPGEGMPQYPSLAPQTNGDRDPSASSSGGASRKMAQIAIPLPLPPPSFSPIPLPNTPDWLQGAWNLLRKGRGFGGGGSRRSRPRYDDEDEDCDQRRYAENGRCDARYDDYAHKDFLFGCKERATDRWRLCYKNGGQPNPSEPPEWGPGDEEIWRNYSR